MQLKNLNSIESIYNSLKSNKKFPIWGKMKVIESLGSNKWLISFLGKKIEIKTSLPLNISSSYDAKLFLSKLGKLQIDISFNSIYKEIEEFRPNNKTLKVNNPLINDILNNIKDEFIFKLLFMLQSMDVPYDEFYKIYDYLVNKKSDEDSYQLPIFLEENNNFIITIPFLFLSSNGLFFLFANKKNANIDKWSFIYFLDKTDRVISVFNKINERNVDLLLYSDIDISGIIDDIKLDLLEFNIKKITLVKNIEDLGDFGFEIIKSKNINFKV